MNERIKRVYPLLLKKSNELARLHRLTREEREDMLQTGLLRLIQMAHRYDPARSRWITFAAVVTQNAMRSWVKRRNRRARRFRSSGSGLLESFAAGDDPQRAAEIAEARRILEDYLGRAGIAGGAEGEALRLYFAEGFSAPETCKLTGLTPTDLKRVVEAARKELRKPAD